MSEGFEFAPDIDEISKVKKEIGELNEEITKIRQEYKQIQLGPANDARISLEMRLNECLRKRERLLTDLAKIDLIRDQSLRKIFGKAEDYEEH